MISTRDQREVIESPLDQGVNESVSYSFDFAVTDVVTITGTPTFALIRSDGLDVTATCMPVGVGSVAGLIATSPIVTALAAGRSYRLYARVPYGGGQTRELFITLRCRA
jgi:hypothetical protein